VPARSARPGAHPAIASSCVRKWFEDRIECIQGCDSARRGRDCTQQRAQLDRRGSGSDHSTRVDTRRVARAEIAIATSATRPGSNAPRWSRSAGIGLWADTTRRVAAFQFVRRRRVAWRQPQELCIEGHDFAVSGRDHTRSYTQFDRLTTSGTRPLAMSRSTVGGAHRKLGRDRRYLTGKFRRPMCSVGIPAARDPRRPGHRRH